MKSCVHGDVPQSCPWCIIERQGKEISKLKCAVRDFFTKSDIFQDDINISGYGTTDELQASEKTLRELVKI